MINKLSIAAAGAAVALGTFTSVAFAEGGAPSKPRTVNFAPASATSSHHISPHAVTAPATTEPTEPATTEPTEPEDNPTATTTAPAGDDDQAEAPETETNDQSGNDDGDTPTTTPTTQPTTTTTTATDDGSDGDNSTSTTTSDGSDGSGGHDGGGD